MKQEDFENEGMYTSLSIYFALNTRLFLSENHFFA